MSPIALAPTLPVIYEPFVEYSFAKIGALNKDNPVSEAEINF